MEKLDPNDPLFRALKEHLSPCRIVRILTADEFDSDGDPVLRLRVVVDHSGPAVEPKKLFSATGVVRDVMANQNDNRFPLLTYPSSEEVPEAAA